MRNKIIKILNKFQYTRKFLLWVTINAKPVFEFVVAKINKLAKRIDLDNFRYKLSKVDAHPQLAVIGVIAGLAAGLAILLLRKSIEFFAYWFMPLQSFENFEDLTWQWRLTMPIIGAVTLSILIVMQNKEKVKTGIGFVIERLSLHQGYFPFINSINQFFVGVFSIVFGFSAGREGPAVHLGSAASSYFGRKFSLPNNSIRLLVASGAAAAIAASFNTPLAGVAFAIEVILLEYSFASLTPVIVASFVATVFTQFFYGDSIAFIPPPLTLVSLGEIPIILILGISVGLSIFTFYFLNNIFYVLKQINLTTRILFAGLLTGIIGVFLPEAMGIGYDSINQALRGNLAIDVLVGLAIGKLFLTSFTLNAGINVGVIGPILVIGAAIGGVFGLGVQYLDPFMLTSAPGLYVIVGMAAAMGALLEAPLAALLAVLELTNNPNIILPAMLAVVGANLIVSGIFKQKSYFLGSLNKNGIYPRRAPLTQALSSVAVPFVMERSFCRSVKEINLEQAKEILSKKPKWIILDTSKSPLEEKNLLPSADLARYLEQEEVIQESRQAGWSINLMQIPAKRFSALPIDLNATLQEAWSKIKKHNVEILYARQMNAPGIYKISGIITLDQIKNYYS